MWQWLSKLFAKKKDRWPAWMNPFIVKVNNNAMYEWFTNEMTVILLENPPGHQVHFLVNGKPFYMVMDEKYHVTMKEADEG